MPGRVSLQECTLSNDVVEFLGDNLECPRPWNRIGVIFSAVVLGHRSTTGQIGGRELGWFSSNLGSAEKTLQSYYEAKICDSAGKSTDGSNLEFNRLNINDLLAERGGFEPPVEVYPLQRFSKPPPSATRPSLRVSSDYTGILSGGALKAPIGANRHNFRKEAASGVDGCQAVFSAASLVLLSSNCLAECTTWSRA
jgi:hypothetical protein